MLMNFKSKLEYLNLSLSSHIGNSSVKPQTGYTEN